MESFTAFVDGNMAKFMIDGTDVNKILVSKRESYSTKKSFKIHLLSMKIIMLLDHYI